MKRIVLISACLLGEKTRYDGGHKYVQMPVSWPDSFKILSVCPEVGCGLSVPREPMRLVKKSSIGLETCTSRQEYTPLFNQWLHAWRNEFSPLCLHGAILKDRSPSCGLLTPFYDAGTDLLLGYTKGLFSQFLADEFPKAVLATEEITLCEKQMQKFIDQIGQLT